MKGSSISVYTVPGPYSLQCYLVTISYYVRKVLQDPCQILEFGVVFFLPEMKVFYSVNMLCLSVCKVYMWSVVNSLRQEINKLFLFVCKVSDNIPPHWTFYPFSFFGRTSKDKLPPPTFARGLF